MGPRIGNRSFDGRKDTGIEIEANGMQLEAIRDSSVVESIPNNGASQV